MPELPEVQTTVNGINLYVRGLKINNIWTSYGSSYFLNKDNIKNPKFFLFFKKIIKDSKIKEARRRGKNILIDIITKNKKQYTIIIHMKMTGHIMYGHYKKLSKKDYQGEHWRPVNKNHDNYNEFLHDPFNRFIRLVFCLSNNKHLVLSDMRKFAKVTIVEKSDLEKTSHLVDHGPEPLEKDFTLNVLKKVLMKKSNSKIKSVLMDYQIIAGIGNIYSDEILWRSGVHPLEKVSNINSKQWSLIYKSIKNLLTKGIELGGDSMSDYRNILGQKGKFQETHKAYQRDGELCSKKGCKGLVKRIKIGGRSAHFCSDHQKLSE